MSRTDLVQGNYSILQLHLYTEPGRGSREGGTEKVRQNMTYPFRPIGVVLRQQVVKSCQFDTVEALCRGIDVLATCCRGDAKDPFARGEAAGGIA
ncbi:unnamed protein product [Protopolystoma xenopodis]|uniref:Uncharacterized protein n=1 Tax=Protopolystoma xenopodis TaxID=117903 RepID=A0A448WT26_9PLAT|nr:unnamed protein product [Protopolystoma xenopodis]